ncbi:pyridoxamine 5'-phosphate oxidase family protein, partial [Escherichia coli]|uniref:pyridoxamine 5'-phosphate oxidase family protein n=2 Tax=Pseudomonadota TaxID=1224 RepID=UPI002FCB9F6C
MNTRLSDIRDSFEGVIPSVIATTGADGMPNISYLSHVHYIDERHVALSNQFFSKTAANVRDRGVATLMVVDGRTGRQHILDLRFLHSTTEGEFFEGAASH